jgi:DnaJ-class molecular chaperone
MARNKPKDFYKILGVAHTATDKEIKSAYRSLARKYHPDVNQGNKQSEDKFKEISEAYSVLLDEKQRYLLDIALGIKTLESDKNTRAKTNFKNSQRNAKNTSGKKYTNTSSSKTTKKDDSLASTFSNLFESILKGNEAEDNEKHKSKGPPRFTTDPPPEKKETATYSNVHKARTTHKSQRGEDITLDVYLMAEEAIKGTVKTINIVHTDPCPKCNGRGLLVNGTCRTCNGKGEKSNHDKLDVKLPAGVKNGAKVRIAKQGNRGINGGDNGDLYLIIKIYNPSNFEFDGFDVLSETSVAPHEAVLGSEIQVLTIDGFVKMKIPPGTQMEQKFRLIGQGLPNKSGERGNHFVKIKIEIPQKLSAREKELYEEISRVSKFNPREYIN